MDNIKIVGCLEPIVFSTFPGGEEYVRLPEHSKLRLHHTGNYRVIGRLKSSRDVMRFFLTLDAMKQRGYENIEAVIPYLPYARQDRVCQEGESLSLGFFAATLNSFGLKRVEYWDEHSLIASVLIDNGVNIPPEDIIGFSIVTDLIYGKECIMVIPDAGACKRGTQLADYYGCPLVQAIKKRDPATGEITGVEILKSEETKIKSCPVIIVDDICDGGRTFVALAKELMKHQVGEIFLYVTHGIFSKGLCVFDGLIDRIYTTDSICSTEQCENLNSKIAEPKLVLIERGH